MKSCAARFLFLAGFLFAPALASSDADLAEQVEIRRTSFGVPHILADNLKAAFFGMAYCQSEDYGERIVEGLVRARGELALHLGNKQIESDFVYKQSHTQVIEDYHNLDKDIRDVYEGFAAGVNYYLTLHPDEFPNWAEPTFSGYDVASVWVGNYSRSKARALVKKLAKAKQGSREPAGNAEEGSNAWAFAPSRTESGHAILVRNPHLNWDAGYYEAHITIPGGLNFYGDFRIGAPILLVGGFNADLGWATTNNKPDFDEVYALKTDPENKDAYLFDGNSVELRRKTITVEFKNGKSIATKSREFWSTPLGPVIHRGGGRIYVVREAGNGEFRGPLQFLRMMQSSNLEEWTNAMRIRGHRGSNFTYADAEGNIFYLWNASLPNLPHPPGEDERAIPASRTSDVWVDSIPFEQLPTLKNPPGGYIQNSNDTFHYTNLNAVVDPETLPEFFPKPRLRLRSQLSLQIVATDRKLSLEEVVDVKSDLRMLLADRVKEDLIQAVQQTKPKGEVRKGLELIKKWDNTVAPESRGGVLFQEWFQRYLWGRRKPDAEAFDDTWEAAFKEPWNSGQPTETPRGLSDLKRAARAFKWAVKKTKKKYGNWDISWGEVHRVRMGDLDLPVGGCPGQLGCFRVLWFEDTEDGKRSVEGGDGWVLAVEFSDPPRAYSVLAYGQSSKEDSPHFNDQAKLFVQQRMKKVAFTEEEIAEQLLRKYRPGMEDN
jgi:acyl-homoserine-lactone acylase